MMGWGALFVGLLALGLVLLWLAGRSRATTGLPAGRLVYADTTRWRRAERPLFSRTHRLTGRPDYLVGRGREVIPVEVKSRRAPAGGPYTAHILQLAAYCLLVEEAYQRPPPYGLILYADDAGDVYKIDYTPALKEELLAYLDEMRLALAEGDAPRDHDQVARCRACGYRGACDQSLA
jgi:CRISPR-associated exonuclease Cas4